MPSFHREASPSGTSTTPRARSSPTTRTRKRASPLSPAGQRTVTTSGSRSCRLTTTGISKRTSTAATAATSIGVLGRRKIALDSATRVALLGLAGDPDPLVRAGGAYALAREHVVGEADGLVVAALFQFAADTNPIVRAIAHQGLTRREIPATKIHERALTDSDWRVRVEAVRGMLASEGDPVALSAWTVAEWERLSSAGELATPRMHAVIEALTGLINHVGGGAKTTTLTGRATIFEHMNALGQLAKATLSSDSEGVALAASIVHCRAMAVRGVYVRKKALAIAKCGGTAVRGWPTHLRAVLAAEVRGKSSDSSVPNRLTGDHRVQAAVISAAIEQSSRLTDRSPVLELLRLGLRHQRIEVIGAAAEGLQKLAEGGSDVSSLADELGKRARDAKDPELTLTLLAAVAAVNPKGASDICQAAHRAANRAVRAGGRSCIEKLTGSDPGEGVPVEPPRVPPVDPSTVKGRSVTWTVETTKGTIVIELDAAIAPWHVASLVSLTRAKTYDGLLWHRVVPNFVLQGGDPDESGWGGPGYTLPAEHSGTAYATGTVGIADAGFDTGGSQWFVTHSPTPHLDMRYTVVGHVIKGQDVVDSIVVGDRIEKASVELSATSQ